MEKKGKVKITGLHIHTGSDITKNNQFKEGIKKIFSIARDFKNIQSIDLGGGIKIPYYKDDTSTNLNDYVKEVSKELKKFELEFNRKLKLIFEPGKFLVSDCGFFITRVNYIKSTKTKDFLQVDSGFNHLLRPLGVYRISSLLKPHFRPIITSSIETASRPAPIFLIYFKIEILERDLAAKWIL